MARYVHGRNESLGENAQRGIASPKQLNKNNKIIHYGIVEEISNDNTLRLKVRVDTIDKGKPLSEIPWSYPLLPMMINVLPKVKETVKVIMMDTRNDTIEREWIGPIISQPYGIKGQQTTFTSLAGRYGGALSLGQSIKTFADARGVFPDNEDIGLVGRDNTDILLKEREVIIRAGKHVIDNPLKLNEKNPAYIKLTVLKPSDLGSYGVKTETEKNLNLTDDRTDTVIMSNKIFLIGRNSNSSVIKPILTKKDHLTLEGSLHPVVYGDVLKEFLLILQEWINKHYHPYGGVNPDEQYDIQRKINNWFKENLDQRLLSKNIFMGGDIPV